MRDCLTASALGSESQGAPSKAGAYCPRACVIGHLVGGVLLVAGTLKAIGLATNADPALALSPLWFGIALVECEWLLGLWLVSNLHPSLARRVALACFTVFAGFSLMRALRGEASCGCFGGVVRVNPWYTLLLDAGCVLALLLFRQPVTPRYATIASHPARSALILTIMFWIGLPWAAVIIRSDHPFVIDPDLWTGERFPLLSHIDIGNKLAQGRWTVVLYRHDCQACRIEVPEYERTARNLLSGGGRPKIALIELPPYGGPGEQIPSRDSPCALGRLDDSREWRVGTPLAFILHDCIVMPRKGLRPGT